MNLRYTRNELVSGGNLWAGGAWPDFAAALKRAVAQVSGMWIYCVQPRAWRLFDGL
jgi:hypothetical protein